MSMVRIPTNFNEKTVRYCRPPKCKEKIPFSSNYKNYDDEESLVENNFNGCMDTINIYFKQVKGERDYSS